MRVVLGVAIAVCLGCGGHGAPARSVEARQWCALRVSPKGLYVDGDAMTADAAVDVCKRRQGALVELQDGGDGDAWTQLEADLRRAGVVVCMRGVLDYCGPTLHMTIARGAACPP